MRLGLRRAIQNITESSSELRPPLEHITPPQEWSESKAGTCPVDGTKLTFIENRQIAHCSSCFGVFLGHRVSVLDPLITAELNELGSDRSTVQWSTQPIYRRCPVCGKLMARRNFARVSGVILDHCPIHGTWYDAGEIRRIRMFIKEGGMQRKELVEAYERQWLKEQKYMIKKWEREGREHTRTAIYIN